MSTHEYEKIGKFHYWMSHQISYLSGFTSSQRMNNFPPFASRNSSSTTSAILCDLISTSCRVTRPVSDPVVFTPLLRISNSRRDAARLFSHVETTCTWWPSDRHRLPISTSILVFPVPGRPQRSSRGGASPNTAMWSSWSIVEVKRSPVRHTACSSVTGRMSRGMVLGTGSGDLEAGLQNL